MSDLLPELIELPASDLSTETIEEVLREQYGLSGQVFPIDGRDNPYFLIDNGHMRYLLKVAPADEPLDEIAAEHALMRHLLRSPDGPLAPEPVVSKDGRETMVITLEGEERLIRLLTFIDGAAPPAGEPLSGEAIAAFGSLSAALVRSLEDFQDPLLEREPEDDLRKAGPQTVALLSAVTDHQRRDVIAKAMVTSLRRIQPLAPNLRVAAAHHDLTADAVVGDERDGSWKPTGLTDFSGISKGWVVAGFANTCAWLLANRDGDAFSLLPAIRAHHEIHPFTLHELEALWPLIVARTAILAAKAESALITAQDDPVALEETERRRALLETVSAVSPSLIFAAIGDVTGIAKPVPEMALLLPGLDPDSIRLVDLSVTSPLLYGGNWTDPENDWKMLARIASETGRAATRYGEYRLSKSSMDPQQAPESFALHIDACMPAGIEAVAPFAGVVRSAGPRLVFSGPDVTLHVEGLDSMLAEGVELAAGDPLGVVAGPEEAVGGLRLRFCRDPDMVPPLFCTADKVGTWSNLCPSPAALLGIEADAARPDNQDLIVRGWNEYLFDATGRITLDLTGTAPLIGHGHPRIAAALYRQSLLLDGSLAEPSVLQEILRQRLADTELDGFSPALVVTPQDAAETLRAGGAAATVVATGLAMLDVIEDEKLMDNARETGAYLKQKLEDLAARFPAILSVSGNGLMLDLELSEGTDLGKRLRPHILVDESQPERLRFVPPLCFSRGSADHLLARLESLLSET